MALSREDKVDRVKQYVEQLRQSQGVILVNYQGLNVGEMERIRNTMRPENGRFQVIKNRLLALALEEVEMSMPDEWLTGPTAVGFCNGEVPPIAKALTNAREETDKLSIKGGWMDADTLSAEQVQSIADLPSLEVLLAQALGTVKAPAQQAAGAIGSGLRQIVDVLQAYVDKLEEASSEADAEMEPAAEPA